MAKTVGPLFSIAASGSVGAVLCFRTTAGRTHAIRAPIPTGAASLPQESERQRMRDAATAWAGLNDENRSEWTDYAMMIFAPTWSTFFREYIIQQCVGETLPLVPAAPFESE